MKAISSRRATRAAALTLLLSRASAALAQSAGDTVDLKSTYVQRLDGAHTGDDAGDRLARAGDVDRDGPEDVIIGAYTADAGGRTDAGAAYLVTSSVPRRVTLGSDVPGVVEIRGGREDDRIGQMVAGIGDVNGDGRPDQAVGGYRLTARGRAKAGSMWVVLSTGGRKIVNVRRPAPGLVRIDGSTEKAELDPAASAGDFNGDGIGDLVVGETDGVYVILRRDFAAVDLGDPGEGVVPISPASREGFGYRVAGVGDLNGDGRADIAVSASNAAARGKRRAGVVAIYYGKDGPEPQGVPAARGPGVADLRCRQPRPRRVQRRRSRRPVRRRAAGRRGRIVPCGRAGTRRRGGDLPRLAGTGRRSTRPDPWLMSGGSVADAQSGRRLGSGRSDGGCRRRTRVARTAAPDGRPRIAPGPICPRPTARTSSGIREPRPVTGFS